MRVGPITPSTPATWPLTVYGAVTTELEATHLPIPTSVWRIDGLALRTTAFAHRIAGRPVLFVRYRVENETPAPRAVRLFAACRPFQVTPPWQSFGDLGGVRRIAEIERLADDVRVDSKVVVPLVALNGFGAAAFEQQGIIDHMRRGELPDRTRVTDAFGYASAALRFDLELPPSGAREMPRESGVRQATGPWYVGCTRDLPSRIDRGERIAARDGGSR